MLEKITPSENKQPEKSGENEKKNTSASSHETGGSSKETTEQGIPDADDLFGDWSGAKKKLGIGRKEPENVRKEDKLL